MFEFSFSELLLCFIVALVVLGPEKMPKVARALGRWTGQARAYLRNLNAELERETQASELTRQITEANRVLREQQQLAQDGLRKLAEPATPPAPSASSPPGGAPPK